MTAVLKKLKKLTGNQYAFSADTEEDNIYTIKEYTDTGCYMLNALLHGSIFTGIAKGKRYQIAGPSSTAKSYFTAFMIKNYLDRGSNVHCVFFESEGSTVLEMMKSVGADMSRVHIFPIETVEDFRDQASAILTDILKSEKDDTEYIFALDSIGMLSTNTEQKQVEKMTGTKDMSKASLLRAVARSTALKFSLTQTPFVSVNHTYQTMDMFSQTKVSGGDGALYFADVVLIPTKGKEQDSSKKQIGCKFGLGIHKSRFTREGLRAHIIIHFGKGLYRYSGLAEFAQQTGVFKKDGHSYILPDGTKIKMSSVKSNFGKYVTDDILNAIDVEIQKHFKFGSEVEETEIDIEEIEDTDDE